MLKDWYSKIICTIKNVMNINIKVTESTADENTTTGQTAESAEQTLDNANAKKTINIEIHKPICEYAHGKKFKDRPRWIVVHYTAVPGASAQQMAKSMKNNTSASSHFYVDDKDIYSAVPLDFIAWHVGDGKCKKPQAYSKATLETLSKYIAPDWRYDLAAANHIKWQSNNDDFTGNSVSIGVDICVLKKSTASKKATDTDWYFKDNAVDNLAKVVAYLANEYNIDIDHIVRHADCTGKLCPRPLISILPNEDNDNKWEEFKEKVRYYRNRGVIAKWK